MSYRRVAPIEKLVADAEWRLAEHLLKQRYAGATYQQLADANGMHRSTVRFYVRGLERIVALQTDADQATSCNALRLKCVMCEEPFTASRADARYCSDRMAR